MSVEGQILALFEEGNPVPDPRGLVAETIDATAYLTTLEQRSSEVTQLDKKQTEQGTGMKSGRTWLVAVVAFVAGLALAFILANVGGGETSPADAGEAAGITFAQQIRVADGETLFAAQGDAVALGHICGSAVGTSAPSEDTPGVSVDVFRMNCDDASGQFFLRVFTELDPTNDDWSPENQPVTWTITGGVSYEGLSGEGVGSPVQFRDFVEVRSLSGTITPGE